MSPLRQKVRSLHNRIRAASQRCIWLAWSLQDSSNLRKETHFIMTTDLFKMILWERFLTPQSKDVTRNKTRL